MWELFGDELSGWGAAAVGGAAVAVLGAVAALLVNVIKAKGGVQVELTDAERKARREDEAAGRKADTAMVKEYKELVAAQRADLAEHRKQIHDLRDDLQELSNKLAMCEMHHARAGERIAHLEDALEREGIPFRKWDGSGSGGHAPIPPQTQTPPPATRQNRPAPPAEETSGE
jgi:septal ring factor EnvC (AmiA/AmiB activator)